MSIIPPHVSVPRAESEPPHRPPHPATGAVGDTSGSPPGTNGRGQRILIVEDDGDLRDLLSLLLSSEGYTPEVAATGTAALAAVAARPPEAIILDVMLPQLNGFEVCKRLKFHRDTNPIPVVMLTSLDGSENRAYGLRAGADRYITKPFDSDHLLTIVGELLSRRTVDQGSARPAAVVEIQMQSESRHLEQLNDMLGELFRQTPLTDIEINRIRYAVTEMVENAVEWGNRRQAHLLVRMTCEFHDDHVRFIVADQGPGFNPAQLPHAASEEDPLSHLSIREKLGLREGGFGILIAKGMVDHLEYNSLGNQVTLIKRFPAAKPKPSPAP